MNYLRDEDLEYKLIEIAEHLGIEHIDFSRLICMRSEGSASKYTLARCHTIPKVIQHALGVQAYYVIEILSENYDKLSEEEKIKTLIHELLHIPKAFGGGFRFHDHVTDSAVNKMFKQYKKSIS